VDLERFPYLNKGRYNIHNANARGKTWVENHSSAASAAAFLLGEKFHTSNVACEMSVLYP